jgi:hypothetical protein
LHLAISFCRFRLKKVCDFFIPLGLKHLLVGLKKMLPGYDGRAGATCSGWGCGKDPSRDSRGHHLSPADLDGRWRPSTPPPSTRSISMTVAVMGAVATVVTSRCDSTIGFD